MTLRKLVRKNWISVGVVILFAVVLIAYAVRRKSESALRMFQAVAKPRQAIPVEVTTEDRDGDKKPDVYYYRTDGKLFRINSDRNYDGKLDEWIDTVGEHWQFRKADENFDRVVDVTETFSAHGSLTVRERDLDRDNVFDFKEFFDESTRLEHSEQDTNEDGKPDVWKYYKDGNLTHREIDSNFDGKPDRTQTFDEKGELVK
ncbi:MAG: hypothetical protein HY587_06885 [Candidatus Omnitrophica bacterium]|nr:hypothetical protein [Candidatus Omnitrophota bacterium]